MKQYQAIYERGLIREESEWFATSKQAQNYLIERLGWFKYLGFERRDRVERYKDWILGRRLGGEVTVKNRVNPDNLKKYRPDGEDFDLSRLTNGQIEFWLHGMMPGYLTPSQAKDMVETKYAYIMDAGAVGALNSEGYAIS